MSLESRYSKKRVKFLGANLYVFIIAFVFWYITKTKETFYLLGIFYCISFFMEYKEMSLLSGWYILRSKLTPKNKTLKK